MGVIVQKNGNSKRIRYFDTLRFIAMFIIYATHFINRFHSEYFSLWNSMPSSIFLYGITGKFGVALFGVILGYFAFLTTDENSTRYVFKRYSFFAFGGLIINFLYAITGLIFTDFSEHSLCYNLLGPVLFDLFSGLPYEISFCISLLLCFIVIVLVSIPVVWLINKVTKLVGNLTSTAQSFIKN